MKYYIRHEDLQTPSNGVAYFGPFDRTEIQERLEDAYAEHLAGSGNVDAVRLTDEQAEKLYINPPDYWYTNLIDI